MGPNRKRLPGLLNTITGTGRWGTEPAARFRRASCKRYVLYRPVESMTP